MEPFEDFCNLVWTSYPFFYCLQAQLVWYQSYSASLIKWHCWGRGFKSHPVHFYQSG